MYTVQHYDGFDSGSKHFVNQAARSITVDWLTSVLLSQVLLIVACIQAICS